MASAGMAAFSGRGTREVRGWRGTAPLSFEWGSEQGGKGRRAAAREEKRTAALGMVGRGDGGRLGETLMGGSHLEVRGREGGGGRLDWAGVGPTGPCGKEREEREGRRWIGLEEERKFCLFFLTQTLFE